MMNIKHNRIGGTHMFADRITQCDMTSDTIKEAIRNGWSVMIRTIDKDSHVPMFIFYFTLKAKNPTLSNFTDGDETVS